MIRLSLQLRNLVQNTPKWYLFTIFTISYLGLFYIIEEIVYFDPKYFTGGNDNSVGMYRRVYQFIYILLPLWFFIQFSFWERLIFLFLKSEERKSLPNGYLFKLLCLASFLFLIPMLAKAFWFLGIQSTYTMEKAAQFHLLSLEQFATKDGLHKFDYFLKHLNLFELLFWFTLGFGLTPITRRGITNNLKIVFLGYGLPILLWGIIKLLFSLFIFPN